VETTTSSNISDYLAIYTASSDDCNPKITPYPFEDKTSENPYSSLTDVTSYEFQLDYICSKVAEAEIVGSRASADVYDYAPVTDILKSRHVTWGLL
jgi:hypothetical protein